MSFDRGLAQTRFGYGRSPEVAGPETVAQMMAQLRGPDVAAEQFAIPKDDVFYERISELFAHRQAVRQAEKDSADREALDGVFQKNRKRAHGQILGFMMTELQRRVWTQDALRERLVAFWADHFSAPGKNIYYRYLAVSHVEHAIRPYVTGRFEDLLIAAVTHPQMLVYLNQDVSIGPNSRAARYRKGKRPAGLNENLAREILELHSLGVRGNYTQADVRQLAELLTGLTTGVGKPARFFGRRAEPGAEEVLGKTYGGRRAGLDDIHAVLRDLARHPDTAGHIAWKLARHFVSDVPDAELITSLQQRYLETDGDLAEVTQALLEHPAAWAPLKDGQGNFKRPELFVSSALRALAVPGARMKAAKPAEIMRLVMHPLRFMGQPWRTPLGPDGFEEADSYWLSAQGLGARLQWALAAPAAVMRRLPDPRDFVQTALGPEAPAAVRFAAKAAENRQEGVALVLMSPAFQRI
ncbi:DUF1800 domain-containing protein [Shimia sp. R11_0]|uniref:DUF1800 domain-containing protein n=1 Tax=Shimia sp. R11_0 TaxID=2821096 RepID=UPI001AD9DF45|nr:DUF1800 domain-containing protein [Shimia sp. R11_0]MBO9478968.1 DUF1800 domain-containing protein [Shimia sp. R11_0]